MTQTTFPRSSSKSSLRLLVIVWPFVAIILAQAAVASFSMQMVSYLRAYVTGESLWSKGQHDAIYFLGRYIETGHVDFLARFHQAMTVPLGDRAARLALEAIPPDPEAASVDFINGGNHPSDVPGLIWLFQYFRWFSYMDQAIGDWRVAEAALLQLDLFADELIGKSIASNEAERSVALGRLDLINDVITPLTTRFSVSLGDGTRFVQSALLIANLAIAALFITVTLSRLNHFVRHRRQIENDLSWYAAHDDLTGLPNRRSFEIALGAGLGDRHGALTLMFLDLDQFKLVNDSGGHDAGDKLLQRLAEALPIHLQHGDMLARLGGDEFGVILRNRSLQGAIDVAEQLRRAVRAVDFSFQSRPHRVTASIGLVQIEGLVLSLPEALRAADLACYIAKEQGRDRVHVHAIDDLAEAELSKDMGWVQRLQQALEEDRFELYAQPIVPILGGDEGEHMELLLRLQEGGQLISPCAFIPAAERFGMMPAIDRWVVQKALKTIALRGNSSVGATYAINLSGVTLTDGAFQAFLCDALASTGVAPEVLCFEITETSAVNNLDVAAAFMTSMRGMGRRFALDDFGVGMSSLTYLKRLPVDFLKIDGSFVRDMLTDKSDRATVEMINHLAHMAGKRTVAEFVETAAILTALSEIGVDYAQGYAIARPARFTGTVDQADSIQLLSA